MKDTLNGAEETVDSMCEHQLSTKTDLNFSSCFDVH